MTCSTCDGYEFVPGDPDDAAAGVLVPCPDCPAKLRCPVHGRIVAEGSTCCECSREARDALPLIVLSGVLHDRAAAAARKEGSIA